jgi:hypothetical protein
LRTGQPQSGKHAIGHYPARSDPPKNDLQPAARARSADHVLGHADADRFTMDDPARRKVEFGQESSPGESIGMQTITP